MLLELRGLSKGFQDVRAVDDLSMQINSGECVALLGPSGCGKTTTLNLIAGFLRPDAGSVAINGDVITDLPAHKRNVAMVFQNYALFPHMTVARNVAYGLHIRHVGRAELRTRVADALELVSLGGLEDRFPRQLSGGQQQRVALARALVINPAVLLLDEPLSNLDAGLRAATRVELVQLLERAKVTTVLVTHDQDEAMAMANRVAVMNVGRVEQIATPEELYASPRNEFAARFLGDATIFHGRLQSRNGETGILIADGFKMVGRLLAGEEGYQDRAMFMVRPEHVRLTEGNEPPEKMAFLVSSECARFSDLGSATRLIRLSA